MAPYFHKTQNEQSFKDQLVTLEQKKQGVATVKQNKLALKELRYEKPFQIKGSSHSKKRQNHSIDEGPEHHYQLTGVITDNMNIPKFKRVNIRPLMTLNPIERDQQFKKKSSILSQGEQDAVQSQGSKLNNPWAFGDDTQKQLSMQNEILDLQSKLRS